MPKKPSGVYAVKKGRIPGVYSTWDDCEEQVKGFGGAEFQKFRSRSEAEAWINAMSELPSTSSGGSHQPTVNHHQGPSHNITSHQLRQSGKTYTTTRAFGGSGSNTNEGHMQQARTLSQVTAFKGDAVGVDEQEKTGSTTAHQGQYPEKDAMTMIVYTDGACSKNGTKGAVAGIGVWWGHGDARNLSERCPGVPTNNRAELIAIVRVLEELPRPSGGERPHLVIRTDSKYSISCIDLWIRNWELNEWKSKNNKDVKNVPVLKYLQALLSLQSHLGYQIKFEHVRGHSGEEGNERADYLARMGTTQPLLPERDWDEGTQQAEKRIDEMLSNASPGKRRTIDVQIEMEDIPEDFLMTVEELEALEESQEF